MNLQEIYSPIKGELDEVENILETSLKASAPLPIRKIGDYLLESPGKRIRPALLILSAKATSSPYEATSRYRQLIRTASAMELIHLASLIHDDIIDKAYLRHYRPTINAKWGEGLSTVLGDYLYALAFELISEATHRDILPSISAAVKAMCEGEFLQVWERGNLNLSRQDYFLMVQKKTASLFSACCKVGALMSGRQHSLAQGLEEYGLNFGMAFQIIDDYLDLMAEESDLGKDSGQDIRLGEITLPIIELWEAIPGPEKEELESLMASGEKKEVWLRLRKRFSESEALMATQRIVIGFITSARENIERLSSSLYKESLSHLTDFIMAKGFNGRLKRSLIYG